MMDPTVNNSSENNDIPLSPVSNHPDIKKDLNEFRWGDFNISTTPYKGKDYSQIGLIFGAEDASSKGMMADEIKNNIILKIYFEKADELGQKYPLKNKISDVIFSEEEIVDDEYLLEKLALFTLQVALGEQGKSKGLKPAVIIGHSFGEFAGMVMSGMMSFEDMFDFIYEKILNSPNEDSTGSLISINANKDKIQKVFSELEYYICLENSSKQIVIALKKEKVMEGLFRLSQENITAKKLNSIPHPFHCPLMNPIKDKISKVLEKKNYRYQAPDIPFYSWVNDEVIDKDSFKDFNPDRILLNHLVNKVSFTNGIEKLYEQYSIYSFLELGPKPLVGKFLSNILKEKEFKLRKQSEVFGRKNYGINSKFLGQSKISLGKIEFLGSIIKKVTGFELENISIEDKLDEDLGIDSLKKMDLVAEILGEDEENLADTSLININTVQDALDLLNGKNDLKKNQGPSFKDSFSPYESYWKEESPLYQDKKNVINQPIILTLDDISKEGFETPKELLLMTDPESFGKKYFILLDTLSTPFLRDNWVENKELFRLIFSNLQKIYESIHNLEVSFSLISNDEMNPLVNGLNSFFKSLSRENDLFYFKPILIEENNLKQNRIQQIIQELQNPIYQEVKLSDGKRWARKFKKIKISQEPSFIIEQDCEIVSIGGAKGISFEILSRFPHSEKVNLTLFGRSSDTDPIVIENLKTLNENFLSVTYISGDVRDLNFLNGQLLKIKNISILINGAHQGKSGKFLSKNIDEFINDLETKVSVSEFLKKTLNKRGIKRFLNFGSLTGVFGFPGDSSYAFSNGFIEKLTTSTKNGIQINWPGWNNTGMTSNKTVAATFRMMGGNLLDRNEGSSIFNSLLAGAENGTSPLIMESTHTFSHAFSLYDFRSLYPRLGRFKKPINFSFEKIVSTKVMPILKDHVFKERCLYPASFALNDILNYSQILGPQVSPINDFKVLSPILVDETPQGLNLYSKRNPKNLEIYLSTKKGTHFKAKLPKNEKNKLLNDELLKVPLTNDGELFNENYYGEPENVGPRFQVLKNIYLSDNMAYSRFNLKDLQKVSGLSSEFQPALIFEYCIQLFSFLGYIKFWRGCLPTSIKKINYLAPRNHIFGDVEIKTHFKTSNEFSFSGNCILCSEGKAILEMEHIQMNFFTEKVTFH